MSALTYSSSRPICSTIRPRRHGNSWARTTARKCLRQSGQPLSKRNARGCTTGVLCTRKSCTHADDRRAAGSQRPVLVKSPRTRHASGMQSSSSLVRENVTWRETHSCPRCRNKVAALADSPQTPAYLLHRLCMALSAMTCFSGTVATQQMVQQALEWAQSGTPFHRFSYVPPVLLESLPVLFFQDLKLIPGLVFTASCAHSRQISARALFLLPGLIFKSSCAHREQCQCRSHQTCVKCHARRSLCTHQALARSPII